VMIAATRATGGEYHERAGQSVCEPSDAVSGPLSLTDARRSSGGSNPSENY
ncbi:hypothetical protein HAX54_050268, partial [Datura stramonium]|nr:hypothetical protein [Datura stramonium]